MQNASYAKELSQTYENAIQSLVGSGESREFVDYKIKYNVKSKVRAPTSAHSNFLINRQVGDWTETLLQTSINQQFPSLRAIKYGAGGNMVAGDKEFKQMFLNYHEELRLIGKRPDLLIFEKKTAENLKLADNISDLELTSLGKIAKEAICGFEVRSSKYLAQQYRQVKGKEQSFTPKLEDIPILAHWTLEHEVPCYYIQMFFDEAHMLSFKGILEIIEKTGNQYLDERERNQMKKTFYMPVTLGCKIGQITEPPTWKAENKCTPDGRIIPYATPQFGHLELRKDFLSLLKN